MLNNSSSQAGLGWVARRKPQQWRDYCEDLQRRRPTESANGSGAGNYSAFPLIH